MKKLLFFASCFALVLIMSKVSVAQAVDPYSAPCTCCVATPSVTLPFNHPGLGLNSREVRRLARIENRFAIQQMRLENRYAVPQLQGYPYQTPPPIAGVVGAPGEEGAVAFAPAASYALPGGVFQTGRRNNNLQRVTANNAPVINFMSIVPSRQPYYPPYYHPATPAQ